MSSLDCHVRAETVLGTPVRSSPRALLGLLNENPRAVRSTKGAGRINKMVNQ